MKKIILATLAATCLISAVAETETTNMSVTGTVLKDYCQITQVPVVEFGSFDPANSGSMATITHNSNTYYDVSLPDGWFYIDCVDGTDYSVYGDYDVDGHVLGNARFVLTLSSLNATVNNAPPGDITDNSAVGAGSSVDVTTTPGAQADGYGAYVAVRSVTGDLNDLPEDLATTIPVVMVVN